MGDVKYDVKYSDLQKAFLDPSISVTLPEPTASGTITVLPATGVAPPRVKVADLAKALAAPLQVSSDFLALTPATVPTDLPGFATLSSALTQELTVDALSLQVSLSPAGDATVNGFHLTLSISSSSSLTLGRLTLSGLALLLDFVCPGGSSICIATIAAQAEFLGVTCAVSVGLPSLQVGLTLTDPGGATPDTILGAKGPEMSLATLQTRFGVKPPSSQPALASFSATADFAASDISFACALTLDPDGRFGWNGFDLNCLEIKFSHDSTGSSAFSLAAVLWIGELGIDGAMSVDADKATGARTVTVSGTTYLSGVTLSGFLTDLGKPLGLSPPAELPDFALDALSFSLTDQTGTVAVQAQCAGSFVFGAAGETLRFILSAASASGDSTGATAGTELTIALQIGDVTLSMTEHTGTLLFASDAPDGITADDLVRILRLRPLYGLADMVPIKATYAALALAPPTTESGPRHLLFALRLSPDLTLPTDPLLSMIMGGGGGVDEVTLLVANAPWSAAELSSLPDLNGIQPPPQLPRGVTVLAKVSLGGQTATAALRPTGQGAATADGQTPGAVVTPPTSTAVHWFDVQRQLGPIYLDRAGFSLASDLGGAPPLLSLLCDASFLLGPVTITLDGFAARFPVTSPPALADLSFALAGLGLTYNKPPLFLGGSLLRQTDATGDTLYAGTAELRTETIALMVAGQYATDANGDTSLALLGMMNDPPLGGPVACFITGLSAGFGYNTALKLPATAAKVADFPLITAAFPGGAPLDASSVANFTTPADGQDWLAAGLLFRSFELVQSTVLLTVAFGHDLRFALLGQSEISVPPASGTRLAYAQVDVEATYSPGSGRLDVFGGLAPGSFVLSPDCRLTGGFAYVLKRSGDFVLSFGGYAANYDYAAHGYPKVSRLGLRWHVDAHTNIRGSGYFAMTPAVMMAGGSLAATWNCGIFSAWFSVEADLFMRWAPFSYEGGFTMSLGVSFDLRFWFVHIHFTFHVGASLRIAGPPFHGTARIDLDVVSFTVAFGGTPAAPPALTWTQFRAMLPGDPANDQTASSLLDIAVAGGLVKDLSQGRAAGDEDPDWVVDGTDFSFDIHSALPITKPASGSVSVTLAPETIAVGILPMALASVDGTLEVTLTDADGTVLDAGTDPTAPIVAEPASGCVAPAHWGTGAPVSTNSPAIVGTTGYRLRGGRPKPHRTVAVEVATLRRSVGLRASSDRAASASPFD